jgi:hypothetical protein
MNNISGEQTLSAGLELLPASPWTAPQLVCIRAGDAEIGANPTRPEGPIATGS